MSIAEELKSKLKHNRRFIHITDADDLLAAWRHRRETEFKRSFSFSNVPTEFRLSAPPNEKSPCMPCHVKLRRHHNSHVTRSIRPAPELSTMDCHGHGGTMKISVTDLDALENVALAKRNIAPYVSPVLDSVTLGLVCKDLGIHGRAVPKMINGRQYIAFSGYPGLRKMFPGTIYSANNRRIVTMAIGALGIKNMVKKGGILTICITVPLTVLECYMKDRYSFSLLAGSLASDLMKIGIGSIMGAIFSLGASAMTTIAVAPIAAVVSASIFTNIAVDEVDRQYKLTEKLINALENMGKEIDKMGDEAQTFIYRGINDFLRTQGVKIPNY